MSFKSKYFSFILDIIYCYQRRSWLFAGMPWYPDFLWTIWIKAFWL